METHVTPGWQAELLIDEGRSPLTPEPFPHIVLDGEWPHDRLYRALLEVLRLRTDRPDAWQVYSNAREGKRAMTFAQARELGATHVGEMGDMLADPDWIEMLEQITGLSGLSFDDLGGGVHLIEPGGFLGVHVDFNRHDDGRYRRINVLVYLNDTDASGELELWADEHSGPVAVVRPAFNRTAIFLTGETSWHGHPKPLTGTSPRCSLAAYYYTAEPPPAVADPHSTIFLEDV